jgi:hypothetical protein
MDNDADFERLLARLTGTHCPGFRSLLTDIKLPLIWLEMEKFPDKIPEIPPLFFNGKLLPYSEILLFNRRELLSSIRLLLPFWYSLPLITAIISFFKNFGRNKTKKNEDDSGEEKILGEEKESARVETKKSLQNCQRILIPLGHTMDNYLLELENRWSKLLDKQAQFNLAEDVKSLVRDYVRRVSRVNRHPKFTIESLGEMANSIITRNSTLQKMRDQDALNLYIKLYLIKLFDKIIH